MIKTVLVRLKSGHREQYADSRPGGSYQNRVRAEGEFLIVTDVWDTEHWYPAADVEKVEVR